MVSSRTMQEKRTTNEIEIGISSCLLGEEVRFDGGHKRDRFITDRLSAFVKFVPVCPEIAIGLGVPRQPIRLVAEAGSHRALGVKDEALDVTEDLIQFARKASPKLGTISGYIFKSKSPSCGMERVKLYSSDSSIPSRDGVGLYARTIMEIMPNLPVEEEGRLNDGFSHPAQIGHPHPRTASLSAAGPDRRQPEEETGGQPYQGVHLRFDGSVEAPGHAARAYQRAATCSRVSEEQTRQTGQARTHGNHRTIPSRLSAPHCPHHVAAPSLQTKSGLVYYRSDIFEPASAGADATELALGPSAGDVCC